MGTIFRLQDWVPYVYPAYSRDFQLLCRLYDVILNGVKYDIDGISRLVNTHECKSTVLQLLQTKLGFFSEKDFTDTTLRLILEGFSALVKKKGTKEAIEEAIYIFLKINNLETTIKVDVIEGNPSSAQKATFGRNITDHCIVVGIESAFQDLLPLQEMLKYIIPFGYGVYFYFFTGSMQTQQYNSNSSITYQIVSDDVNTFASSVPIVKNSDGTAYKQWDDENKWYTDDFTKRNIASINNTEIVYSKDESGRTNPGKEYPEQATEILEKPVTIDEHGGRQ